MFEPGRQPQEFEASLLGFRKRQLDLAGLSHDPLEPADFFVRDL
jgi:hypothetical protein